MTPSEIEPGMRFGNWEVISLAYINKHHQKYFSCKCLVCGTIRDVRGTSLIDGTSTACSRECANNLIGQKFGEWEVIGIDKTKKRAHYICRCSCGTVKSVAKERLKYGRSRSCGCLRNKERKQKFEENARAHIGETYGFLTIYDCYVRDRNYWYKCKCKCGNEKDVCGKHLFTGDVVSCGCINSKANELMDKILTKYNISFKREYRFEDCRDSRPLPFDFALFNNQDELIGLIENNGALHYSTAGTKWDSPERLLYQQKHDYIKRKFCEDNGIPFLVIPYQYFNQLEKFLITSDFWRIITKNFND